MQEVITFANMKGGVGKTTLCVNVALDLLTKGYNVLVLDNDPQFNATSSFLTPRNYINKYIKGDLKTTHRIYERPLRTGHTPAPQPKLSDFEAVVYTREGKELALIGSSLDLHETLSNSAEKELRLDKFIERHCTKYDFILIDCPPTPSVLTRAAFAASAHVVIPVTPEYFSTFGLPQFIGTMKEFKDQHTDRHDIKVLGVVFTNVPTELSKTNNDTISYVKTAVKKEEPPVHIFDARLPRLAVFQRSALDSKPVQMLTGPGTGKRYEASVAVGNIVKEMIGLIERRRRSEMEDLAPQSEPEAKD